MKFFRMLLCAAVAGCAAVHAAEQSAVWSVTGELPPLAADVTELKFREFFKMPIGPRGLEPTPKLLALNGKRVRLVGYMAKQEQAAEGVFILTPLPVVMGDEDDSLADDLPASAVFVHLPPGQGVAYVSGLIYLTGVLSLGSHEEADGHVAALRLLLERNNH